MKKLYTILLSAAVALGASAATETVSLQLSNADGLKTITETETSISRTALRNTTLTESFAAKGTRVRDNTRPNGWSANGHRLSGDPTGRLIV